MTTVTFSVPDHLEPLIHQAAKSAGYDTLDAYAKELLMESLRKRAQGILEEKIQEALETEAVELEEGCWEKRRADFKAAWEKKKSEAC
ncbi:MAG: hypothetical protein H6752_04310 [Candidatus Omnitrophica bacterium]|nr:hypothetical protein [Candidatus Omnitrophota bacterium]